MELKPHELYEELVESRKNLDEYFELFIKATKSTLEDTLITTDFFIVAVSQRSIDIIEAYKQVIDSWNITSAGPLIRMQLDNLLRLVYISKISNSDEITLELFNGKSFYDFIDSEGKRLTDVRLRQHARDHYPWIDEIYKKASKFIHFSEFHMRIPIDESDKDRTIAFSIRKPAPDKVSREDIKSYFEIMNLITNEILRYIYSWAKHKKDKYE
ncbi:hypothetical protein AK95_16295 [Paenibacillus sp. LC231]|uniref:hypothetical protein n=1 Tax=Paenibacillus sp. LC231 TaxID=1120679 RepID=UPI0008DC855F|nr:hypothetical protein [Paenibacillus sp. LC231]OIA98720.1 hypothetical protein AK95_16295 [Paenibacillus sp. LC231]